MENQIKQNIKIAIQLLNSSRTDGYGNGKITHSQRDFIIQETTELLTKTFFNFDQKVASIIPKNNSNINPPDES